MKKKWTVVGGGNGGHATAAHLSLNNQIVRMYDVSEELCKVINEQGGIYTKELIEGFGSIEFATTDMKKAIEGSDIIVVVVPAFAHRPVAKTMAPHLKSGQKILLHPGATFGALDFLNCIRECGNKEDLIVGEALSLLYATRLIKPGTTSVFGIKSRLPVGVIPATETESFVEDLKVWSDSFEKTANVLETSLQNLNVGMHPLPTILSTSLVESDREWLYYYDGITPSVSKAAMAVDRERVAIAKEMGIELPGIFEAYSNLYDTEGETLTERVRNVKAYAGIKGHSSLDTRYITEDIPMGIIPYISLGKVLGVNVDHMEATVLLAETMLEKDLHAGARTVSSVGLSGMTKEEIKTYIITGKK